LPWVTFRELRRIERERTNAESRADSAEKYSRALVNSFLTAKGQQGVAIEPSPSEKHFTPSPALPATVQGWTQEEFVDTLTADGTYKSRGEALEAWKSVQTTGKFPYQNGEEFLT